MLNPRSFSRTPAKPSQFRFLSSIKSAAACLLAGVISLAALATSARADMAATTRLVWKLKYGVTDVQLASSTWLAADDDGDGISNGDEILAGTNPFSPSKTIKVSAMSKTGSTVTLLFPTEDGKRYRAESTAAPLSSSSTWTLQPQPTPTVVAGNGQTRSVDVPYVADSYYRIRVDDVDTDGDGISDWAEKATGFDPTKAMTSNGTPDGTALAAGMAAMNLVTVTATRPSATQPGDSLTPPVEVGTVTVSRGVGRLGTLSAPNITVPLQKLGTALESTDYDLIATTAAFNNPNVTQVTLTINPKYNSARRSNVTAIVKAQAGTGYALSAATSASVVINPAGIANGTGLTGAYQNTSSSTYSTQQTIFSGAAEMTRTDATVDFSSGVNGWGAVGGPTGLSPASTTGAFSVRWTGQILPQYSERYFIDMRSDESAKVWVNGLLLIDRWATQGATDYTNTIDLSAGVLYDIVIEYWNSATGSAEARLYWWSASQPKQIIPTGRLFPALTQAQKLTAVTNTLNAVGYELTPFLLNISTPNISGAVTYAVDANSGALPAGLSLNPTTGIISGTPTAAGSYNVAINATNTAAAAVTGSSIINFTIYPIGSVTRETLAGSTITADGSISSLDDDMDYPNNISRRLRGYIVPPKTGNYYFWLAANNTAELWISNDAESVNRVRRATVTASTGKKAWSTSATQKTAWLSLVAGKKYYFDVLHNTGTDPDTYVQMGWCQDDIGTVPSVIGDANPTAVTPVIAPGGAPLQGYPLSGTVPSYLFQPYDYPPVTPSTGKLYSANIGPQGSSSTKASGSANLQVNQAQTQAILHFSYQNLGSPRTNYHLHTDGFASHPAGEIIYDIDDIDSFHPELKTPDGGYIWNLIPVGTFTDIQQLRDAITGGKVYLNVHTVNYPNGEIRGNLNAVDGSQTPPDAANYSEPPGTDVSSNYAHAARFLNQATFGASPSEVSYVQTYGFGPWIDNQLLKPASHTSGDVVAGLSADINTPYPSTLFTDTWWKYSITGQDQLRQRLAFALSEILVVSWNNNTGPLQSNGRVLADYYDNLVDYCLPTSGLADSGNFRGILKSVTLTPAMGLYLDMRGNQKEDLTIGRHPNENYAREIMQLFSVGLNRQWDDGKFVLNGGAELIPTYTQPSILGMAGLMTGWNYAQANQTSGRLPTNFGPAADYLNAMVLVPSQHDLVNPKLLLNSVVTPAATGLVPRVTLSSASVASPSVLTTSSTHGLRVGDTVRLSNVTGGNFSSPINATHVVTEIVSPTSFKVGINCTSAPTAYTNAAVTGATVTPATYSGSLAAIAGSQADSAGTNLPHPYDQYGLTELDRAIDNICNNDNVPPYLCRQLIQRLVTSAPSPGYVYRVVQKWKNNGAGVRGDLSAVVRQILLDGEARSYAAAAANGAFGKQREPMLRLTGAARAFPAVNYVGSYVQLPADTINANKLRLTTTAPNDFSSGFSVSLDFRGNYVTTTPPNPISNPTTTTYSVNATLPIAATHLDVASIGTGNPTVITTAQPHGLGAAGTTKTVWPTGFSGSFGSSTINGGVTATVIDPTTFSLAINTTRSFQVASVAVGNPCVVTTTGAHNLPIGTTTTGVTVNGVNGGTFAGTINSSTLSVVGLTANTFSVTGVGCSSPPTSYLTWREVSNPCLVTTQVPHGLSSSDSVTIGGVSGGTFTPLINGTFPVTVVSPNSFTIASSCSVASTPNTGNIVGGNTMDVAATGMVNVTYSQPAGSNVLTVNTGGPQTDVAIPVPNSATTTLKSKVYLDILTGTAKSTVNIASVALGNPCTVTTATPHGLVGGEVVTMSGVSGGTINPTINGTFTVTYVSASDFSVVANCTLVPTANTGSLAGVYGTPPADGIYQVNSTPGTTSFTVLTSDTPVAGRTGSVIVPKISTSYTPLSNNTIVQFNTNVNHNMTSSPATNIWVDVPVVGSPLTDAEYTLAAVTDEDHFTIPYLPVSSALGTYPKPSGSNNGITIFPLAPPPMGRSGNVTVNQSTFNLGSTESTLTQSPLNAPTVFNYFFPNYKFPGTLANAGLDSPEFQLSTDTNISNLTNSLTNTIIGTGGGNGNLNGLMSFNNGNGSVVLDVGGYLLPAKTADSGIDGLIDELANLLVGGPLEAATKTTIKNFVTGKRISAIGTGNPCTITSPAHGYVTGNLVTISGVSGGTFSTAINSTFAVTVTGLDTFTVPVNFSNNTGLNLVAAGLPLYFPMTTPTPTNQQMRDRVRAIIHLIITSAEFAVQK